MTRRARLHLLRCSTLLLSLAIAAVAAPARADCKPTHEIRENGSVLRLRVEGCALSVAETGAALDALLTEAFAGARMSEPRATLELGRIVSYPWLSKALADAAVKSPVWDPKRGRGRRDSDESAVKVIVDTRRLLAPLAAVFARHGAKARASSVEKVLVGKVGDTEALAPLAGQKLAEGKKLPYDAILWLRLERADVH